MWILYKQITGSRKDALKCREHFERTLVRSEGRSAGSA